MFRMRRNAPMMERQLRMNRLDLLVSRLVPALTCEAPMTSTWILNAAREKVAFTPLISRVSARTRGRNVMTKKNGSDNADQTTWTEDLACTPYQYSC